MIVKTLYKSYNTKSCLVEITGELSLKTSLRTRNSSPVLRILDDIVGELLVTLSVRVEIFISQNLDVS